MMPRRWNTRAISGFHGRDSCGWKSCSGVRPKCSVARRGDLQAILIDRQAHRAAAAAVIAVTQRIRQSLPQGDRRVERVVDPLEQSRHDPARDRQVLPQKAFRFQQQLEGVPVELAIVQKFAFVDPLELRHPQQALGKLRLDPRSLAEQHHRRPQQHAVPRQPQAAQQLQRVARAGILQPAPADRFVDGAAQSRFGRDRRPSSRPPVPSPSGVHRGSVRSRCGCTRPGSSSDWCCRPACTPAPCSCTAGSARSRLQRRSLADPASRPRGRSAGRLAARSAGFPGPVPRWCDPTPADRRSADGDRHRTAPARRAG
jgi:hypothetical protein